MLTWRRALWAALLLIVLLIFPLTRFLLIRLLLLPAGLHWFILLLALGVVLVAGVILWRRSRRAAKRQRIRDLERELEL